MHMSTLDIFRLYTILYQDGYTTRRLYATGEKSTPVKDGERRARKRNAHRAFNDCLARR